MQISENKVFQFLYNKCRILNFNLESKYTSTIKTAPVIERWYPSLVKVENYIILAAGYNSQIYCLSNVSYYNVAEDKWSDSQSIDLPPLNQARYDAAACCLKDQVYIFAGYDGKSYLNSIEKIGAGSLISNGRDRWELIQTSPTILSPRREPAVAPLNNTEIMIFGGYKNSNNLGDVIVFDTKTKQCTKVMSEGASKFYAHSNRCVQATNDKVIGLVSKDGDAKGVTVFSWSKGASAITVVKEYKE